MKRMSKYSKCRSNNFVPKPYPRYITVTTPLVIEKNAPPLINSGDLCNYSINITNIGHMTLDNVTITDPFSDKILFNSIESNYSGFNEDNWEYNNHTLTIAHIVLDIGDKIGFIIFVTVVEGASGDIINTAFGGYSTVIGGIIEDVCNSSIITHINAPPIVGDIPNQQINEGGTFTTINLDEYVHDIEDPDEDITWTHSDEIELIVDITDHVATITTPHVDWNGQETIVFRATDTGGLWDEDQATFSVSSVNDPPVAFNDEYDTNEDISLEVVAPGVLSNDQDIDGDTLTAVKTSGPTHGTVTLNANGSFSYLPFADYNGDDSFTYKTYDGEDYSNIATVTILITSVNDPPNTPSHPYPNDNVTNIDINIFLRWRGVYPGSPYEYDPDGDPVTFDIYFGTNNSPPLMVHNQSNTSYDPILNYNTVYYWKIIAWDNHNASNASEIWRFTTQEQSTGGGGSSNKKPVADSSAGEPYQGFINEEITFNGSRSYDPDGTIISWYWTFGDGTHGNGKNTTHTYLNEGTYHATLTVADNNGDTGTDSFTVVIVKANHPPSIPSVDGPVTGHQNSTLEFTALSFDADNDTIQYIFDWGDGETTRTGFLQNGTVTHQTHQWATYGEYRISVSAFDNESESGAATYSVLIDVIPIDDEIKGYLVDEHSENTYNVFDNTATGRQTSVEKEDNSTYLIDSDGNGKWDYAFNLKTGLVPYSTYVYQKYYALYQNAKTPGFEALSVLAMLVLVVIILRRRRTI
ncbi:MAG: PKD domain-containing protein [Methanobacteriota archaeon]